MQPHYKKGTEKSCITQAEDVKKLKPCAPLSLPHPVSKLLGNQQLAGHIKFLPLRQKQKEGGRESQSEGSPGGCQSRFKWRHPACSVWAGPPPPRLTPPSSWALQEFPSSSHYSEETAGNAPHRCRATADRAETQTCDCFCWHRSMYALVVPSPLAFCFPTKGASECLFHETSACSKRTFCPIDCCETLTRTHLDFLHYLVL